VVWSADYLPFGQADVTVETVENNLRFAGQYYDAETGLHYNYHRYYDPKLGRYLKPDPSHYNQSEQSAIPYLIPFYIRTPSELHDFVYVRNNPLKYIDSSGLSCGPGQLGDSLIPDLGFGDCCDAHDDCYAGTNGHYCKDRVVCDREFCECMMAKCASAQYPDACRRDAQVYCDNVKLWGWMSYKKRDKCDCD
jgi:RHS repeat-associated protein